MNFLATLDHFEALFQTEMPKLKNIWIFQLLRVALFGMFSCRSTNSYTSKRFFMVVEICGTTSIIWV